ncbi:4-alpha-glucanotransferase [Bacillota bacterium LX-D]|nr:4-alpha-glucanotransferase [Bacillota bacterium LX-D]
MILERGAGVLLHPTSLPGKWGMGELGSEAVAFLDFLQKSKQKYWQILPLNTVGEYFSPYQCYSAFAGNHLLISLEKLVQQGLLAKDDLAVENVFDTKKIDYNRVRSFREKLLKKAFAQFRLQPKDQFYWQFVQENCYWLRDYCFFMALKEYFQDAPWNKWDQKIAFREEKALAYYRKLLAAEIEYHQFLQFVFFQQWLEVKNYAGKLGIKIIGDLPIFVAHNSSDVWAHTQLFKLDALGNPEKVAGVPPDYFSPTGQLWGSPVYNWSEMEKDTYRWWQERFKFLLKLVDILRIDHFRGFEAYWEIPGSAKTAAEGEWVKGPESKFFAAVERSLGPLPAIAEDLGFITRKVIELKDQFSYPGMKVLQFILGAGEEADYNFANYDKNSVIYTGTHDNDTTLGWYEKVIKENPMLKQLFKKYLQLDSRTPKEEKVWQFIKFAYETKSQVAIIPLQDILSLGSEARMNYPGTTKGNWQWRFAKGDLTKEIEKKLSSLVKICAR